MAPLKTMSPHNLRPRPFPRTNLWQSLYTDRRQRPQPTFLYYLLYQYQLPHMLHRHDTLISDITDSIFSLARSWASSARRLASASIICRSGEVLDGAGVLEALQEHLVEFSEPRDTDEMKSMSIEGEIWK